ncbi:MAG: hypothetical protein ACFFKA_10310 [Candidatus Thorarchaeota archaeon]
MNTTTKYQWIKGEFTGLVEEVNTSDGEFTYFKSGHRIRTELIGEFFLPLANDNERLDENDIKLGFTQDPGNYASPQRKIPAKKSQQNLKQAQQPVQEKNTKVEFNPIKILIDQAAKEEHTFNLNFTIKVPKKILYSVIKESFDVDVDSEITNYILGTINHEKFKKQLESDIKKEIKEYYK